MRGLWFVALINWLGSCPTIVIPYGILNAKNLSFKFSFGTLYIMYYCTMYWINYSLRSNYRYVWTYTYTHTCRFDGYNLPPQKMGVNGAILLKLLKFHYFSQNTGISLLSRYNALQTYPLYIFCYRIHYYTYCLPLSTYTIP